MAGLEECRWRRGVFPEGIQALKGHRHGAAGIAFNQTGEENGTRRIFGVDRPSQRHDHGI